MAGSRFLGAGSADAAAVDREDVDDEVAAGKSVVTFSISMRISLTSGALLGLKSKPF